MLQFSSYALPFFRHEAVIAFFSIFFFFSRYAA